jgi:hypothetical protein
MRNPSQFSCWDVQRVSEAATNAPSYVNVLFRLPARKPRHVATGILPLWAISHPKRACLVSSSCNP